MSCIWATEGVKSGIVGNGTVLADTDELVVNSQQGVTVLASASVSASVTVAHRNAANNADIATQLIDLGSQFRSVQFYVDVAEGERMVVRTAGALSLGNIQASLVLA